MHPFHVVVGLKIPLSMWFKLQASIRVINQSSDHNAICGRNDTVLCTQVDRTGHIYGEGSKWQVRLQSGLYGY